MLLVQGPAERLSWCVFWSILYFLSQERTSSTCGWPKMKAERKVAAPRHLVQDRERARTKVGVSDPA